MGGQPRNPKDDMTSTWFAGDRTKWTIDHWLIHLTGIYRPDLKVPIFSKNDKIPFVPQWRAHCWIFTHAIWPLVVHQLFITYTGYQVNAVAAYFWYVIGFKLNAMMQIHMIYRLASLHGYLDGDMHQRDGVPDNSVNKVWFSLDMTSWVRPLMLVALTYKKSETPLSMTPWVLLELSLYPIVLDFYFYWYHRAMHEFDGLWKYHRTHHLTKHPNPLLTLFADAEQEFFDAFGMPLLTFWTLRSIGLPMSFYDWWMCQQWVVFIELMGHSGLRIHGAPPNVASWFLSIFDAELVIEDHDLHHRKGWRTSANYGKQTRLWDKAFGTCGERIESRPENVDYVNTVKAPLF